MAYENVRREEADNVMSHNDSCIYLLGRERALVWRLWSRKDACYRCCHHPF